MFFTKLIVFFILYFIITTKVISNESYLLKKSFSLHVITDQSNFIKKTLVNLKRNTLKSLNFESITQVDKIKKITEKNKSTKSKLVKIIHNKRFDFSNDKFKVPLRKKNLNKTNFSNKINLKILLNKNKLNQGETLEIILKSSHKIWKCFGDVGGKRITFLNVNDSYKFKGFFGFGIHHYTGKVKILLAVLFHNGQLRYVSKEVKVFTRYVPKVRVWIYKKHRRLIKYKKKGKLRRRWKTYYSKRRRWIAPPKYEHKFDNTSFLDFKKEVNSQIFEIVENEVGLGGDDEENNHFGLFKEKLNQKNAKEKIIFRQLYELKTLQKLYNGYFYQPVYPKGKFRVSGFGKYRVFRYKGKVRRGYHKGLDIAQSNGTLLQAPNYGIVALARYFRARGNTVVIDHGGGVYTLHYHLSKILVKEGMFVRKGDNIGHIGSTGVSTGPHLHWEIRVHGVSVNSLQWRNID